MNEEQLALEVAHLMTNGWTLRDAKESLWGRDGLAGTYHRILAAVIQENFSSGKEIVVGCCPFCNTEWAVKNHSNLECVSCGLQYVPKDDYSLQGG